MSHLSGEPVRLNRIYRTKDVTYLRVLHFAINYKRGNKEEFYNQLPFVMCRASLQAAEFGFDSEEDYAAYGASVDLGCDNITFYGMVKRKVRFCAPLILPATHEAVRDLLIGFFSRFPILCASIAQGI